MSSQEHTQHHLLIYSFPYVNLRANFALHLEGVRAYEYISPYTYWDIKGGGDGDDDNALPDV